MSHEQKDLLVALDIGTSQVTILVAEPKPENGFELLGMGVAESKGIRAGIVNNIESMVQTIKSALDTAEHMVDCQIGNVHVGVTGSHIFSFNSRGVVAVKSKEITKSDVDRVLETARAVSIPAESEVLHVLEREYIVDNQGGILDPIGMSGVRLEVDVHIVAASSSAVENVERCIRRCGLHVRERVLQPLASSRACLTKDEQEIGTVLLDIGAGTTDIVVYYKGSIYYSGTLPLAGDMVTSDIASSGLNISKATAEQIKIEYGAARKSHVKPDECFTVENADGEEKTVQREFLALVMEARLEEIFKLVQKQIQDADIDTRMIKNYVLTGGTALTPGIAELAEDVLHAAHVRIASPKYDGRLSDMVSSPRYSTAVGLLTEARSFQVDDTPKSSWKVFFTNLKNWLFS